jgi:ABC-type branched-subunit amino acid transport system substrate-binding protein
MQPAVLNAANPNTRYRTAKTLIDQNQYELALKELAPLVLPTAHFARAADAAYLSAVAQVRLGQWAEAEQLLNLIRHEYPTYANIPDVLLLQGQVSFEQEDFDTAMRTLAQLPDTALVQERSNLKANYLPRLKDRAAWQRMLTKFPQDATLGQAAADFLAAASSEADRTQLDQLITRFSLDRSRYAPRPVPAKVARKASYNVAVLLPFELSDPSWQTQRKIQFVTDLYAGLRLAQDSLQRAGRPLQLFAYDTGPDTLSLKAVLALPELAGMDLLVGPIYKSGSKLLARYAQQHQIVCVNPLSQDADLVADNPWHYLFSASAATQGREAAQFAFSAVGGGRPAVIIHEESKDEADFAQAYKAAFEATGGRVSAVRHFNPATDASLTAAFSGLDWAATGHVVVVSDDRKVGPAALSALRAVPAAQRPVLLGPGSWLDNPRVEPTQLDNGTAYLIHPKYLDVSTVGYRRFRALYLDRQHLPPSVFASTGFELLLYFGQALHQYGPAFQAGLSAEPVAPGCLFSGLGYPDGAHDNQQVPITKLDHLDVQVLNPPLPR